MPEITLEEYELMNRILSDTRTGWWKADYRLQTYFFSKQIMELTGLPSDRLSFADFLNRIRTDFRFRIGEEIATLEQLYVLCFYGISDFLNLSAFSISQGIFYRAQIIRKDDFGERFLHFVHNHFHRPQFILLIVLAHDDLLVTGFCVGRHGKGHACSRERCPFDV